MWLRKLPNNKRVCVMVLGDIGRSPRMQYHALSFANSGYIVDLIGYGGSKPDRTLLLNENIYIHYMAEPPEILKRLPRLVGYASKALYQAVLLCLRMCLIKRPQVILLQNPPSIPSMAIAWFVSRIRSCKFVIDWHNYGYSIMSLTLGERHKLVKIAKWYEHYFGRKADGNICVTNAMKEDLAQNWKIDANTHYDRPPVKFKRTNLEEQHELFVKLSDTYDVFKARSKKTETDIERTCFTVKQQNGRIYALPCRPALLVSSTSWTEDEDFSILLNALDKYEVAYSKGLEPVYSNLPKLVCVITGKGPTKARYLEEIKNRAWKHIQICTPWLEAEDYPTLLGSCDLGVCLHTSSSGLDLPMKVVDMFGCGLPVCAVCFKCLPELVEHNKNGMIFHCANELYQQIEELLTGFPNNCRKIGTFRENLKLFQSVRWHETWKSNVLPICAR